MEGVPIWSLKKFNNYSFALNNCTLLRVLEVLKYEGL